MSALICGSMAYDTIMVFHDQFKNHILPDKVHMLNVSFLVPEMRREFGGCAGNIAYNLKLLGGEPFIMATVGDDFTPYAHWLDTHVISRQYIRQIENSYTGQAFITTDRDDNQITAFHPGAMSFSHLNTISMSKGIKIGIVSPDGRQGMIDHATQFAEAGIPFIFDPGQGLPMFDGNDLKNFIKQASWITVNDYEAELLQQRTGLTPHQIAEQVQAYIVTQGGKGSLIYTKQHRIDIPTATAKTVADPTGCGDAYRAGLLYGLTNELDWETTGRVAALMGTLVVEHHGTQKHQIKNSDIHARFKEAFGYNF
ncbi:MAG: carbohydrate kinase family protein [Gammaproteobacteria bacterium]|nr:carbohydrate kinase family protein [Gammaproteobacteria bacterium]